MKGSFSVVRQVPGFSLWIGHIGDARDLARVPAHDIVAVVDLALNERPETMPREMVYCRFPLVDGAENPASVLRTAIDTLVSLLANGVATLVYCGAGMSRSVCIAAAAIARLRSCPLHDALAIVSESGPADVSAGLFADVQAIEA